LEISESQPSISSETVSQPTMDGGLNDLLRWSIENSTPNPDAPADAARHAPNPDALNALFGGPSDAELMKASMEAIRAPDVPLEDKLTAFDNLEQLVESIDNANLLAPLGLWAPLIELLSAKEKDLRRMAAWCVGTAVQNNPAGQERALVGGAVPVLVELAVGIDHGEGARRKAVYAISSLVRNYQPAADAVYDALMAREAEGFAKIDAANMEEVDGFIDRLRRT
jgi:hsp70-interacting protein